MKLEVRAIVGQKTTRIKEVLKNIIPIIGVIIFLIVLFLVLWKVPELQVAHFESMGVNNSKELADLENESRAILAQIIGGLVLLSGLYFTWRQVFSTEEGQITERFTRAIDQLGKKGLEFKLGGIYGLERIAKESKEDHWPIMEILTAYVREHSSWEEGKGARSRSKEEILKEPKPLTDIQAILTVFRRRTWIHEKEDQHFYLVGVNLCKAFLDEVHFERAYLFRAHFEWTFFRNAHLEGAQLWDAHLEGAILEDAHLEGAILEGSYLNGAHLENAHLENAHLKGAYLYGAHLEGAILKDAQLWETHLEGAYLYGAHLEGAHLSRAHLEGAYLNGAHLEFAHLNEAYLEGAHLQEANLRGADLEGADLEGADLAWAYLRGADGLTADQLSQVKTLYEAELDEELLEQVKEKTLHLFDEPSSLEY